jgi:hypothetical protein
MCAPDGCLLSLGDTSHTSNAKSRINLAACLYKGEFAFDPGIKPAFGNICKFGVDIGNFQASETIHIPGMSVYDRSGFLSYRNNFTDKAFTSQNGKEKKQMQDRPPRRDVGGGA